MKAWISSKKLTNYKNPNLAALRTIQTAELNLDETKISPLIYLDICELALNLCHE